MLKNQLCFALFEFCAFLLRGRSSIFWVPMCRNPSVFAHSCWKKAGGKKSHFREVFMNSEKKLQFCVAVVNLIGTAPTQNCNFFSKLIPLPHRLQGFMDFHGFLQIGAQSQSKINFLRYQKTIECRASQRGEMKPQKVNSVETKRPWPAQGQAEPSEEFRNARREWRDYREELRHQI